MSLVSEVLVTLGQLIFYWLASIVAFFRSLISPKQKDVSEDVVVITGAGSGLGQLMCLRFAKLGSTVVGWDINSDGLRATADLLQREAGAELHSYVCDVSSPDSVYSNAERTAREVGPISIFVNNAGVVTGKLFEELSDGLIEKVFKINAISHFWTTKAVLPDMKKRKRGHLVYIASCAGLFGAKRLTEYCASKGADVIFAESLYSELQFGGHPEVKVTCVCPWFITTGMFAGCESKFPIILPNLTPEYTVDRIMAAVLSDQYFVVIPRLLYVLYFLKALLPTKATMALYRLAGGDEFMERFEGRALKDE